MSVFVSDHTRLICKPGPLSRSTHDAHRASKGTVATSGSFHGTSPWYQIKLNQYFPGRYLDKNPIVTIIVTELTGLKSFYVN